MIKRLDLYLFKTNIFYFIIGCISIYLLFVFIDLFDKYFSFTELSGAEKLKALFLYYLYGSTPLLEKVAPFIFGLTTMMTLSRLQQNSQIVAIHACGISIYRVFLNFILSSFFLGFLIFLSSEYISPKFIQGQNEFKNIKSKNNLKNLHFKDKLSIEFDDKKLKNKYLASIDIEKVNFNTFKAEMFHATLFDEIGTPFMKVFSKDLEIINSNEILIKKGIVREYRNEIKGDIFLINTKINLNVSIKTAYFAQIDPNSVKISELLTFIDAPYISSLFWYRVLQPFQPFLGIIIIFSYGISILYKKAIYAYFYSLSCCVFVFLMNNYIKNELQMETITPITGIIAVFLISFLPIIINRKNIPS